MAKTDNHQLKWNEERHHSALLYHHFSPTQLLQNYYFLYAFLLGILAFPGDRHHLLLNFRYQQKLLWAKCANATHFAHDGHVKSTTNETAQLGTNMILKGRPVSYRNGIGPLWSADMQRNEENDVSDWMKQIKNKKWDRLNYYTPGRVVVNSAFSQAMQAKFNLLA